MSDTNERPPVPEIALEMNMPLTLRMLGRLHDCGHTDMGHFLRDTQEAVSELSEMEGFKVELVSSFDQAAGLIDMMNKRVLRAAISGDQHGIACGLMVLAGPCADLLRRSRGTGEAMKRAVCKMTDLTLAQMEEISRRHRNGESESRIACKMALTRQTVQDELRGHLMPPVTEVTNIPPAPEGAVARELSVSASRGGTVL